MLDGWLIAALGFFGSFGHCVGMCGPLTVAFSLATIAPVPKNPPTDTPIEHSQGTATPISATIALASEQRWQRFRHYLTKHIYFHGLLNLGRMVSYSLTGAVIGGVGSLLVAGGQLAGMESDLRRWLAIITGLLLLGMGIAQVQSHSPSHSNNGVSPKTTPQPTVILWFHNQFSRAMLKLSWQKHPLTPAFLGLLWGLMPCGFLYTAQLKAATSGSMTAGAMTMLIFGLGTLPAMLAIGTMAGLLSQDRRSQLFRLGGWITITIGGLTLIRTDATHDYTGQISLILMAIALVARPIAKIWDQPLKYRRLVGVAAFVLAVAHTLHMTDHAWQWNPEILAFMLPVQQWGVGLGFLAVLAMLPAAVTSFDGMVQRLGKLWYWLHWLTIPAWVCALGHTVMLGSRYLGGLDWSQTVWWRTGALLAVGVMVLLVRQGWLWHGLGIGHKFKGSRS
ncbi:MAG: sulfite exporter TauE/SafE family protein [Pseudanabaena sp. ELA607]